MEKENLFLSEVFQNYDFYESVFHSFDDEFDSFVSVYGVHFLSDIKLERTIKGYSIIYMNNLYFVSDNICYLISTDLETWKVNELRATHKCLKTIADAVLEKDIIIFEIPNNATIDNVEKKIKHYLKIWKDNNGIRYIRYYKENEYDYVYTFGYDFQFPTFLLRSIESVQDRIIKVQIDY